VTKLLDVITSGAKEAFPGVQEKITIDVITTMLMHLGNDGGSTSTKESTAQAVDVLSTLAPDSGLTPLEIHALVMNAKHKISVADVIDGGSPLPTVLDPRRQNAAKHIVVRCDRDVCVACRQPLPAVSTRASDEAVTLAGTPRAGGATAGKVGKGPIVIGMPGGEKHAIVLTKRCKRCPKLDGKGDIVHFHDHAAVYNMIDGVDAPVMIARLVYHDFDSKEFFTISNRTVIPTAVMKNLQAQICKANSSYEKVRCKPCILVVSPKKKSFIKSPGIHNTPTDIFNGYI
jgi:hypothetical protein